MASPTKLQLLIMLPLLLLLLLPSSVSSATEDPKAKARKEERASEKLSPCAACSALTRSFEKGMARTARGKLEGGDTDWEERKQVTGYARSEVRFVEIEEELCKDVDRGSQQCHQNHQEWEEDLAEWWRERPAEEAKGEEDKGLRQWLCVERLEVCCPEDR